MNFFALPLPTDVSVLELKFLEFDEQRAFGGVSRRCLQLSDAVTRLTTAWDVDDGLAVGYGGPHPAGIRRVITDGKLPMLRSVTLAAPVPEAIDPLMSCCPRLDTLCIDFRRVHQRFFSFFVCSSISLSNRGLNRH